MKDEDGCMQPLKLLVVEDNIASLELMTEVFTSLKTEVRAISDSEKAVGSGQSGEV
jgi:CheY-like chemotaxis protein